jgi:hypothetical protein
MKQLTIIRMLTVMLLALALSTGIRTAQAQNSCCISLPQPNHVNSLIVLYPPTGDSCTAVNTFQVTLANSVGAVAAGTYPAWCIDAETDLNPAWLAIWSGQLISVCDPNELSLIPFRAGIPPVGPPPVVTQTTWNEINYILNHKGNNNYWNVQAAINSLVGGPPFTNNPAYCANNTLLDQNAIAALLAAAAANPNYQVPCGGVDGIVYALDDAIIPGSQTPQQVQVLILEVPCTCPPPTADCVTISNAMVGVPITPVTMTGSGGCGGPYTFSATGLPPNLMMSSGGTISGTPTISGTFTYTVTVTDVCSNSSSMNCSVTVAPPQSPPLGKSDTATIGFWHNKNGQALILSLNGGPTNTNLGTWLATNYPCLFGDLNGKSNSIVAARFLTYFGVSGTKTYAQVMAGALAAYATSTTLAGGIYAGGYGFNTSSSGTGAKTYNVGSNGTAIGLSNNTAYTISQILQAANAKCPWNTTVFNALNTIFDGINQSGDIK